MFKIASVSGAPRPRWGSLRRSPKTLYSRYTIGSSCLRQSKLRAFGACNFPDSQVYMRKTLKFPPAQSPPARTYSTSIFSTSNMSHYLKFFKICPANIVQDVIDPFVIVSDLSDHFPVISWFRNLSPTTSNPHLPVSRRINKITLQHFKEDLANTNWSSVRSNL